LDSHWILIAVQLLIYAVAWLVAMRLMPRFQETSRALALSAECFLGCLLVVLLAEPWLADTWRYSLAAILKIQGFLYVSLASAAFFGRVPLLREKSAWLFSVAIGVVTVISFSFSWLEPYRLAFSTLLNAAILCASLLRIQEAFAIEFGGRSARIVFGSSYFFVALLLLKSFWQLFGEAEQVHEIDIPGHLNIGLAVLLLIGNGLLYLSCAVVLGVRLVRETTELSIRDPLTGLLNRRGLGKYYAELRLQHEDSGAPYSLLMLDIDHFKHINDRLGHAAGDYVLGLLARKLHASVRSADVAARMGGEEFLLILSEMALPEAAQLAERLRIQVAALPLFWEGEPFAVSISLGLTQAGKGENDFHAMLERADAALYQAKESGRNRLVVASPPSENACHGQRGQQVAGSTQDVGVCS